MLSGSGDPGKACLNGLFFAGKLSPPVSGEAAVRCSWCWVRFAINEII